MIGYFTSLAERWYHLRWWCGALTLFTFALLWALMLLAPPPPWLIATAFVVAGPLVALSWGILCMCVWFHPTHGLLISGRLFNRLPMLLRQFLRGYFALFLAIWFLFGTIGWVVFCVAGAWA